MAPLLNSAPLLQLVKCMDILSSSVRAFTFFHSISERRVVLRERVGILSPRRRDALGIAIELIVPCFRVYSGL